MGLELLLLPEEKRVPKQIMPTSKNDYLPTLSTKCMNWGILSICHTHLCACFFSCFVCLKGHVHTCSVNSATSKWTSLFVQHKKTGFFFDRGDLPTCWPYANVHNASHKPLVPEGEPAPQRTLTTSLHSRMRQPAVDVAVRGSEQSGLPESVPVYEPLWPHHPPGAGLQDRPGLPGTLRRGGPPRSSLPVWRAEGR